ncbi:MAG: phosphopentomutase [Peptococcaceae bacterium]|nr:phosphopentomutase [Peptococcaceae bacterium]
MRFFIIVLDSVGMGALPDAGAYGDEGSNTLRHIANYRAAAGRKRLYIPHLGGLGLGHIEPGIPELGVTCGYDSHRPLACFGRMAEKSAGKDTITGHWEIAGLVLDEAFPTFPQGFPAAFLEAFEARIGRGVLGNEVASGTEIIARLGNDHVNTGRPIVYTSADSVFQVAAHEETIPLEELMEICRQARDMLTGELGVARVIARPFAGGSGEYVRTGNRRDFAVEPVGETLLDRAWARGHHVLGIGKIGDIFAGRGMNQSRPSHSNQEGMELIIRAVREVKSGIVMANLVDFDMLYGHRNDVEGYARALEEFDAWLPELLEGLGGEDVVVLTADHGCDPTMPGTDHSREYVPLLVYGKGLRMGIDLGSRTTFADVGQTVADALGLGTLEQGKSFWGQVIPAV